jgi:hypothetical protein
MKPKPKLDFDIDPEQRERLTKLFGSPDNKRWADFTAKPDKESLFSRLKKRFKKKK